MRKDWIRFEADMEVKSLALLIPFHTFRNETKHFAVLYV